ncbi:hypothetical protein RAA17_12120 [Komagataeibacter rhaeticus]|nr:hypothetical protein [Komagataeibacter rhaeticus]
MPDRAWIRVSGVDRDGTYFVGIYNVRSNIEARAWLLLRTWNLFGGV